MDIPMVATEMYNCWNKHNMQWTDDSESGIRLLKPARKWRECALGPGSQ